MNVEWNEIESGYVTEVDHAGDIYSLFVEQSPNHSDRWVYTIMLDIDIIAHSHGDGFETEVEAKEQAIKRLIRL